MAWLAITWNNDRILFLTAKGTGSSLAFDRAFAIEAEQATDDQVRAKIRETVAREKLAKYDTLIVLPRGDVEIRSMSFPFVPEAELPELVRFQAGREFNGYDEGAPVDFLLLKERSSGTATSTGAVPALNRRVLATALPSVEVRKWMELCETCHLKLRRLLLRPCETTALWRRDLDFNEAKTALLVEVDSEEASQAVVCRGQPIFMRSPRLMSGSYADEAGSSPDFMGGPNSSVFITSASSPPPTESSAQLAGNAIVDNLASLIAELKRTRFAVRNEVPPVSIDSVVLCGTGRAQAHAAAKIQEAMEIPASLFDPWAGLVRTGELKSALPFFAEQYAPLLGAILSAATGTPADLDLANPKRKPETVGKGRILAVLGVVAALVLVSVIAYGYVRRSRLEAELKTLAANIENLKKVEAAVKKQRSLLNAVEDWDNNRVNWFEQLDWFSRSLPDARDTKLTALTLTTAGSGSKTAGVTGVIDFKGYARNGEVLGPMEEHLRDKTHLLSSGAKRVDTSEKDYGYYYEMRVYINPKGDISTAAEAEKDVAETAAKAAAETVVPREEEQEPPDGKAEEPKPPMPGPPQSESLQPDATRSESTAPETTGPKTENDTVDTEAAEEDVDAGTADAGTAEGNDAGTTNTEAGKGGGK